MSTVRTCVMSLSLLAFACGGDDDPDLDAAAYAGTWLISSVTIPDQGAPTVVTRDGQPLSIRGDAVFAATGDTTGTLAVRQVILDQGLISGEVMTIAVAVTVEPERWVLADPGGVSVYAAALTGDHLALTLDPADPRNTNTEPTTAIIVDRVPAWTTTVVGAWELVSLTLPSGTVTANTCIEVNPGTTWGKVQMLISFDGRLLFERTMTTTTYADATCATPTGTQSATQTGLAEEEGGVTLRMWGVEDTTAEQLSFAMTRAGNDLTLTRTACLPQPACTTEAPTVIHVTRH